MVDLLREMKLNPDKGYINRGTLTTGDSFCFDGYSVWYYGQMEGLRRAEGFTLFFEVAPYGWSGRGDGLFSCYDSTKGEGLSVSVLTYGTVEVSFGLGKVAATFTSLDTHLKKDEWNRVIVCFRGAAGWCDLIINGKTANRMQFRRHSAIAWPERPMYLGKHLDHGRAFVGIPRREPKILDEPLGMNVPMGCFWGLMRSAVLEEEEKPLDELVLLSSVNDPGLPEAYRPDRSAFSCDADRPQYHLIPPERWMNEPHGPMYYNGYYHIFYQANLHAPVWDHIQWGHLASSDMVHWKDLPPALETEEGNFDEMGIWSGNSVIDEEGIPRLYYTAGDSRRFPNQAVAMAKAADTGDPLLTSWKKYPRLVKEQDTGWPGEFRDPFVWRENGEYFMLVGTGDEANGGGNAALYVSPDGLDWTSCGFLVDYDYAINHRVGHIWELPVLLPLKNKAGGIVCHILLLCACQIEDDIVETYYFLGHWDAERRHFELLREGAGAGGRAQLLDLGHGYFTGPSGFVTPDGRSVLFTIAQEKRGFIDQYHAGWAHNGGLPVELWWEDGVRFAPVREISGIRGRKLLELSGVSLAEAAEALSVFNGNRFCLQVRAKGSLLALGVVNCMERRTVFYERGDRRLGILDPEGKECGRFRGEIDRIDIGDEEIALDLYLDHSMIEVYLNDRKSVTIRNYAGEGARYLDISGEAEEITSLTLWEMDSAYEER